MQTVQSFLYLHACWRSCTQFTADAGQVRTHAQKYFQKMARISASGTPGSKVSKGVAAGRRVCYSYYLLDEYDRSTATTSMARTTGYTCALVARQFLNGMFTQKGISPPEAIGRAPGCWDDLVAGYERRNIRLAETVTDL